MKASKVMVKEDEFFPLVAYKFYLKCWHLVGFKL
jgi:hypothetical protein